MAKGGNGNKRQRTVDDDDKGGPTKVQLKGLSWNSSAAQPSFLRNALSALSGPKDPSASPSLDASGRPAIPTRPDDDPNGDKDSESEEDEWDLARGDEAPAVVVLKEGKHLGKEEVDRMRAEAKANSAPGPTLTSSHPSTSKTVGSLSFSTSTSKGPRKASEGDESWEQVIARSKAEKESKERSKAEKEEEDRKAKERKEKEKKKEKKKEAKKVKMLSFDE